MLNRWINVDVGLNEWFMFFMPCYVPCSMFNFHFTLFITFSMLQYIRLLLFDDMDKSQPYKLSYDSNHYKVDRTSKTNDFPDLFPLFLTDNNVASSEILFLVFEKFAGGVFKLLHTYNIQRYIHTAHSHRIRIDTKYVEGFFA